MMLICIALPEDINTISRYGFLKKQIMKIFTTAGEINDHYRRSAMKSPGFVPTMGALHEGHMSLVEKATADCRMVAVSFFVNPTQFNDPDDLKKYPRTPEADTTILSEILRENDFVFIPSVKEIYPEPDKRVFDFGNLDRVMEGVHRPGHFNGVAQVVSRLFDIVRPSAAYFGQKDFQQVTIIREMARRNYPDIRIIPCPIVREKDGLAMSSRNRRLLPEHRLRAGEIYKTLRTAASMITGHDLKNIRKFVADKINTIPGFRLEYFEIVEDISLKPVTRKGEMSPGRKYFGCIALFAGEVRLIDNIEITL